jgi:hypothetical protein
MSPVSRWFLPEPSAPGRGFAGRARQEPPAAWGVRRLGQQSVAATQTKRRTGSRTLCVAPEYIGEFLKNLSNIKKSHRPAAKFPKNTMTPQPVGIKWK